MRIEVLENHIQQLDREAIINREKHNEVIR